MMYNTFLNHFLPVMHYLFSYSLLILILPVFLFRKKIDSLDDFLVANYLKMILLLIVSGYILVTSKLFEVISIIVVFVCIFLWSFSKTTRNKQSPNPILKKTFDYLDGIFSMKKPFVKKWFILKKREIITYVLPRIKAVYVIEAVIVLIVICFSGYIRFYDAFVNAAPPMADSYVTLAWMKYINFREIFHDGIYPQGFHLFLAYLLKFAPIDSLYILRYTGPLNTLLIAFFYYFVIRKLTGSTIGAIIALCIYGFWLPYTPFFQMERQAATNSQEFAFTFIFPTIYFLFKYYQTSNKACLKVFFCGTVIIGLVHSLALALIGLLIGLVMLSFILIARKISKKMFIVSGLSILAVILSLLPFVLGFLIGKDVHSTSAEFLVDKVKQVSSPMLFTEDYAVLLFIFLTIPPIFIKWTSKEMKTIALFSFLGGLAIFSLYYWGGVVTQSTLISARSVEFWSLIIPFCIGITCSLYTSWIKNKLLLVVTTFLGLCIFVYLIYFNPTPIIPYKLEHNETIEQYFQIRKNYENRTWTIVSHEEGYPITYGYGYHMHLSDFLNDYDPKSKALTRFSTEKIDSGAADNIFILYEKQLFKVSIQNSVYSLLEPSYKRREKDYKELKAWIEQHRQQGYRVDVFYEDKKIIIYHLRNNKKKQRMKHG